jgi:uncharacterized protein
VTTERLLPAIDVYSAPFWEATARGELRIPRCGECGHLRFPPRPFCPACTSETVQWPVMAGTGSIWSFVVVHPPVLEAYLAFAPYNVIVVELDEDPSIRMVGNLVSASSTVPNSVDRAELAVGRRVRVVFDTVEDVTLPLWTLV